VGGGDQVCQALNDRIEPYWQSYKSRTPLEVAIRRGSLMSASTMRTARRVHAHSL